MQGMLKDFSKINTFLTVAREKSFSKASAKIGISQPAVTQQIKFIEEYLQCKVIERKKNGIILTKEGEELYRIAVRLEECIGVTERELIKIVDKELPLQIGASYTVGNYILPEFLTEIRANLGNDVIITVDKCNTLVDRLLEKKIDIALIEAPSFKEGVFYREWMDDEIVMFSNVPLPVDLTPEDLNKFSWVHREEGSHTRKLAKEALEKMGMDCRTFFDVHNVLGDITAIKQTVLKAPRDEGRPVASIVSKFVIADELAEGKLYATKVKGCCVERKLYIAFLKENKHDAYINNVVNFLMQKKPKV